MFGAYRLEAVFITTPTMPISVVACVVFLMA